MFWEIGKSDDGKKVLINPQSQNSYLYANGNPVTLSDPSGRASVLAWIVNPFLTGTQVVLGKIGSKILEFSGKPASAELFGHSFNLNPKDVYYGNGSVLVNSILNSSEYKNQLEENLSNNQNGGVFNIEFNPKAGDVKTAIGKISLNVTATKIDDNKFNISTNGIDNYNFGYNNEDYGSLLGTAANIAYFSQTTEAISNFNVNIQFNHEYKTLNNKNKE